MLAKVTIFCAIWFSILKENQHKTKINIKFKNININIKLCCLISFTLSFHQNCTFENIADGNWF